MLNPVLVNQGSRWSPAFMGGRSLGQAQAVPKEFIDDPTFLTFTGAVAAGVCGWVSYAMYKGHNPWASFWLVAATGLAVKAFHDSSRTG
jgi:hypothetical protein